MKAIPILALLLLTSCNLAEEETHCEQVQAASVWLERNVTTHAEMQQEIEEILIPDKCNGITAGKLKKLFLDLDKLSENRR